MERPYSVLFVCEDNAARSIVAEAVINRIGLGRFNGFSAGLAPRGAFDPDALRFLERTGYAVDRLVPASWRDYAWPGAPSLDLVVYLRNAAPMPLSCPWRGAPRQLIWNLPVTTPAPCTPALQSHSLQNLFRMIERRTSLLVSLPDALLSRIMPCRQIWVADRKRTLAVSGDSPSVRSDRAQVADGGRRASDRRIRSAA